MKNFVLLALLTALATPFAGAETKIVESIKKADGVTVPAAKASAVKKSRAPRKSKNILSEKNETAVLNTIDTICGDAWCAGDYNFEFTRFACDGKDSCTLSFIMFPWADAEKIMAKDYSAAYLPVSAKAECTVSGITKFSDIFSSKYGLTESFSEKIGSCISDMLEKTEKTTAKAN